MTATQRMRAGSVDDFFNTSGSKLNSVRTTTPVKADKESFKNVTARSAPVHIDLYNFEDPKFEASKYVLTSPRSLEACSRLALKPAELLHKTLAELQDELLPEGIPLETVYTLYDEQESRRIETLRLCREERARIIREDVKKDKSYISPQVFGVKGRETAGDGTEKVDREKTVKDDVRSRTRSPQRPRTANVTSQSRGRDRESLRSTKKPTRPGRQVSPVGSRPRPRPRSASAGREKERGQSNGLSVTGTKFAKPPEFVSSKDRKIIDLLASRQKDEQEFYREREQARVSWTDARLREQHTKDEQETRRRLQLAGKTYEWEKKRVEDAARWEDEDEELKTERESMNCLKIQKWERSDSQQRERKEREIAEKKHRDSMRKKSQERNLAADEHEREEMAALVLAKQKAEVEVATIRREKLLAEEQLSKRETNKREERRWLTRLSEGERQRDKNIAAQRRLVEGKHERAAALQERHQNKRDRQIVERQAHKEARLLQSIRTRAELEDATERYQNELRDYQYTKEHQAEQQAEQERREKARRIARSREERTRLQRDNLRKLQEDESDMKRSMEVYFAEKQAKADAVINKRDMQAQQSRALAANAERLRGEIKNKYGGDNFDRRAQQVLLESRIGQGSAFTGQKNASTVKIG